MTRFLEARLTNDPPESAKSIRSYETAVLDEHGNFTGRYKTKTIKTFSIRRPMNIMQFDFQVGGGGPFTASTLGCAAVNSKGYSLRFVPHVQEITGPGPHLRWFRVYFLFDQQLTPASPDQPFVVEYQCEVDDPYINLGTRGEGSMFFRTQGDAEEMTHAVAFPRNKFKGSPRTWDIAKVGAERLKEIDCELEEGEDLIVSEELEKMNLHGLSRRSSAFDEAVPAGRDGGIR
jgi:hypothetical protein